MQHWKNLIRKPTRFWKIIIKDHNFELVRGTNKMMSREEFYRKEEVWNGLKSLRSENALYFGSKRPSVKSPRCGHNHHTMSFVFIMISILSNSSPRRGDYSPCCGTTHHTFWRWVFGLFYSSTFTFPRREPSSIVSNYYIRCWPHKLSNLIMQLLPQRSLFHFLVFIFMCFWMF